jgi:hypothetical protein
VIRYFESNNDGKASCESLLETNWRGALKKYMYGILSDFIYNNFNVLKITSLEMTHSIQASLPLALHFPFHLNLCYLHLLSHFF